MKKFISLSTLALVLTSVIGIAVGSAKIASNCCNDTRLRPTTNRVFAYNYRNHLRRKVSVENKELSKFVFWYNFQQQKTKTYNRHDYAAWRSAHDALFPRDENLHSNEKLVVRHDDVRVVQTAQPLPASTNRWYSGVPGISVQLAADIISNENGQYEDVKSDLVFTIQKFKDPCTSLGFQLCAVSRAKSIRAERDLKAIKNVSREFSLGRAFIDGKNMLVPHFQEVFTVNDFGIERTYVIHTIQNPLTKEVVYVEGYSSSLYGPRTENLLRAVARTIRFK